ncbi:T9SS type A sorting domain-containing protein [Brumimicrobium aurantiacum]|uniref:T9SS C-terminal target domain-containing protein n=1 Tax=Brumimicrobium aurantiacum TaxID=1737063 RepID=A0A3E1EYT5_9FLAO|nr:T9SS type A sorting domain-containing protein [Brumimicrobium aurantiacum]RFC54725.1 T9SS C-terminal target domain-containing protein [Brumimicrobium aurantiacum]
MKSLITLSYLLLFGFSVIGQSSFLHHQYPRIATPNMGEEIEFADFDNDGYKELFNYIGNGNARIYNASINGIDSLGFTEFQVGNNRILTDWNNDGLLDIVFHNSSIQWVENMGNFVFDAPEVLSSSPLFWIKSADINTDSYIDLYSYINNTINFFINQSGTNSTSNFSVTVPYNINVSDVDIKFNDIENDGLQEMFVKAKSNKIYIYTQTGSMDYTLQDSIVSNSIGPTERESMHFQDLNNDGNEEIVIKKGTILHVLQWTSGYDYNFVYSGNIDYQSQTGAGNPQALEFNEFYDVDQNGFSDIIIGNSIFFNNGSFSFNNVAINTSNQIYEGTHRCHDIDNNGYTDVCYVATAGNSYSEIGFFHRENTTSQSLDTKSTVWNFWNDAFSVNVTVDYENDGDIDNVSYTTGKIVLWENINDSLFPIELGGSLPYFTYDLNTVDINQDSLPDFLWSSEDNFTAQHGYLINGGSNGTFSNIKMDLKLVADIDGDGKDELFYHNRNSGGSGSSDKILMYELNSGVPVLASTVLQWSQFNVSDVIVKLADYDLDGLKDVIIQHEAPGYNKIRMAHNDGSNNFSWGQVLSMDCKELVGVFDSNGDQFPEIHWLDSNNKIYRHINNAGTFGSQQTYYTLPSGSFSGAKGFSTDFNNDYLTDLIIQSDTRQWQLKSTGIGLQLIHTETASNIITRIEDLDEDGDDDFVAGDTWYENTNNNIFSTKGSVYFDMNTNGDFDQGTDLMFPSFPLELNNNWLTTYTDNSGNFNASLGADSSYVFSIASAFTNYFTATTTPYPSEVNVNLNSPIDSISIGVTNTNNNSLDDLFDTNLSGSRCNEQGRMFLQTQNISPEVVDLEIKVTIPANTSFSSSNQPSTQIGDTVIWQLTGVTPFEISQFYADFNLPGTAFMMDTMNFYSSAKFTGSSNTRVLRDTLSQIVTCAYDPNDKNITMTEFIYEGDSVYSFKDETEYMIRFQNTGNDTAVDILIHDQLSNLFDWSTAKPISASHSYNFTVDTNGIVNVKFKNIHLPDSNVNFLGSMGYIKFKVDYDPTSPTFEPVKNHALIYFDQNPPIVTNVHKFYRVNCLDFVNPTNQSNSFCYVDTISVSNNDYGLPFDYEWSIGSYTDYTKDSSVIPFDTAGFQSFSMKIFGFGCSSDTSIFMDVKPIPLVTISIGDTNACQGQQLYMTSNQNAMWQVNGSIQSSSSSSFSTYPNSTSVIRASVETNGCLGEKEILVDVISEPSSFHSIDNSLVYPGYNPICLDDTVILNSNYDSIIFHVDYMHGPQTDFDDTTTAIVIPVDPTETGLWITSQLSYLGCDFSNNIYFELFSPDSYTLEANNGSLPIQAENTNHYCDENSITVDLNLDVDWYYNGNLINSGIYCDATQSGIYTWVDSCGLSSWFEIVNNNSNSSSHNITICEGENFTAPDGTYFTNVTSAFSHNSTFTNQDGCDSIVTSNVNVLNTVHETEFVEICKQFTWVDGNTYFQSTNSPTYTYSSVITGCDSIVTLNLTIKPPINTTDFKEACVEYTWIDGITYTESTDTPTDTLTSIGGCDSIVTLDLIIKPNPDTDIYQNDSLLNVFYQATTYQWLNCDNNYNPVLGATNRFFVPPNGGSYAAEINLDGCIDTSECISIEFVDIPNYYKNKLSLTPNPADEKIFITGLNEIPGIISVQVISITGKLVKELNGKSHDIIVRDLSKGEYFVRIIHAKGIEMLKFIKT